MNLCDNAQALGNNQHCSTERGCAIFIPQPGLCKSCKEKADVKYVLPEDLFVDLKHGKKNWKSKK